MIGCLQNFVKTAMMTLCVQLELKFIGHLFVFVIQNNIMAKPNYITEEKFSKCIQSLYKRCNKCDSSL
jgi:hypothetical protein